MHSHVFGRAGKFRDIADRDRDHGHVWKSGFFHNMTKAHDFDSMTFCSQIAPKDADPVLLSLVETCFIAASVMVYVLQKMR